MIVEFATNSPLTARRCLNVAFPNAGDDLTAVLEDVVQLVADGKCRVRDPHMYGGNTAIVPEKGYEYECVAVHERLNAAAREDYYQRNPEKRPEPPFVPKPLDADGALALIERMRELVDEFSDHGIDTTVGVHMGGIHDGVFYKVRPKADARGRLGSGDEKRTLTCAFKGTLRPGRYYPPTITVYGPQVTKITRKTKAKA